MKKIISILAIGSVLVAAFVFGNFAFAAPTVTNGGFELGTNPGVFTQVNATDSSTITGWTVNSGSVDYIGSYWQASDGSRSLDLNGSSAGSINQTLATTAGATYVVTFHLSGNPDLGPAAKVVRVAASGATPASQDYTYDTGVKGNTKADMKWESDTFTFTASGASTVLSFSSQVAGAAGPALDNVSIQETVSALTTPHIFSPANGTTLTSADLDKVDWTNATGGTAPYQYQYESYHNAAYTDLAYSSGWLNNSEIPTPGTPEGTYYLRVRAKDSTSTTTPWSNGAGNVYKIIVDNNADNNIHPTNILQCLNGGWRNYHNPSFKNVIDCIKYVLKHQNDTGDHPNDKKDCKHGGWRNYSNPSFKNQGQCIKYVNQHKHDANNQVSLIEINQRMHDKNRQIL